MEGRLERDEMPWPRAMEWERGWWLLLEVREEKVLVDALALAFECPGPMLVWVREPPSMEWNCARSCWRSCCCDNDGV